MKNNFATRMFSAPVACLISALLVFFINVAPNRANAQSVGGIFIKLVGDTASNHAAKVHLRVSGPCVGWIAVTVAEMQPIAGNEIIKFRDDSIPIAVSAGGDFAQVIPLDSLTSGSQHRVRVKVIDPTNCYPDPALFFFWTTGTPPVTITGLAELFQDPSTLVELQAHSLTGQMAGVVQVSGPGWNYKARTELSDKGLASGWYLLKSELLPNRSEKVWVGSR